MASGSPPLRIDQRWTENTIAAFSVDVVLFVVLLLGVIVRDVLRCRYQSHHYDDEAPEFGQMTLIVVGDEPHKGLVCLTLYRMFGLTYFFVTLVGFRAASGSLESGRFEDADTLSYLVLVVYYALATVTSIGWYFFLFWLGEDVEERYARLVAEGEEKVIVEKQKARVEKAKNHWSFLREGAGFLGNFTEVTEPGSPVLPFPSGRNTSPDGFGSINSTSGSFSPTPFTPITPLSPSSPSPFDFPSPTPSTVPSPPQYETPLVLEVAASPASEVKGQKSKTVMRRRVGRGNVLDAKFRVDMIRRTRKFETLERVRRQLDRRHRRRHQKRRRRKERRKKRKRRRRRRKRKRMEEEEEEGEGEIDDDDGVSSSMVESIEESVSDQEVEGEDAPIVVIVDQEGNEQNQRHEEEEETDQVTQIEVVEDVILSEEEEDGEFQEIKEDVEVEEEGEGEEEDDDDEATLLEKLLRVLEHEEFDIDRSELEGIEPGEAVEYVRLLLEIRRAGFHDMQLADIVDLSNNPPPENSPKNFLRKWFLAPVFYIQFVLFEAAVALALTVTLLFWFVRIPFLAVTTSDVDPEAVDRRLERYDTYSSHFINVIIILFEVVLLRNFRPWPTHVIWPVLSGVGYFLLLTILVTSGAIDALPYEGMLSVNIVPDWAFPLRYLALAVLFLTFFVVWGIASLRIFIAQRWGKQFTRCFYKSKHTLESYIDGSACFPDSDDEFGPVDDGSKTTWPTPVEIDDEDDDEVPVLVLKPAPSGRAVNESGVVVGNDGAEDSD